MSGSKLHSNRSTRLPQPQIRGGYIMGNRTALQTFVGCLAGVLLGMFICLYHIKYYLPSEQFNGPVPFYENELFSQNINNSQIEYMDTSERTGVEGRGIQFVLIFALMRTGSTLTGDVLQIPKETFYSFEPLYNVWHGKQSTFDSGETKIFRTVEAKRKESLRMLKLWYTCDLMNIDLETYKHVFMDYGIKTNKSKFCMMKHASSMFTNEAREKCMKPLIKACNDSSVRIVKTIRLYARDIEPLMATYPNMKFIHLVRDPRGTLVSRLRVDKQSTKGFPLPILARDLCNHITDDTTAVEGFRKLYKDRVMTLRYEDLATRPEDTVRKLYRFLGMNVTSKILASIKSLTSSKGEKEQNYNTFRKDSSFTANKWRIRIRMNETKAIDEKCVEMYETFGYRKVNSEQQLRNFREKLWDEKLHD